MHDVMSVLVDETELKYAYMLHKKNHAVSKHTYMCVGHLNDKPIRLDMVEVTRTCMCRSSTPSILQLSVVLSKRHCCCLLLLPTTHTL